MNNTAIIKTYNWLTHTNGINLTKEIEENAAYAFETPTLHIMITNQSTSDETNTDIHNNGLFQMETKETFLSWDSPYYSSPLPQNREEFNQILLHMKEIQKEEHIERADSFFNFFE